METVAQRPTIKPQTSGHNICELSSANTLIIGENVLYLEIDLGTPREIILRCNRRGKIIMRRFVVNHNGKLQMI